MSFVDFDGGHEDSAPCVCGGGCGWHGTAQWLDEIEDCSLTPGDPSPAGRCPRCGSLAYLDRPKDRAMDQAERLAALTRSLLEAFPWGTDDEINGGDVVEFIGGWFPDARSILDKIDAAPESTCSHAEHEDCMNCQRCGTCDESLDDEDICSSCRDEEPSPTGWRLASDAEIAQGFKRYQHENGNQQDTFPLPGDEARDE